MRRSNEILALKKINLEAVHTQGHGNCLFHALSDQLYGDQSSHAELRAATVEYMRANATYFKSFISVHPGGGTRRSLRVPKRKNPGALAHPEESWNPTAEEIDAAFERHLAEMKNGGAYGDNLEIVAFANSLKVNVWIFSQSMDKFLEFKCKDGVGKVTKIAYIVHHDFEHYSSIRNSTGPMTGPPNVVFVGSCTTVIDPSTTAEDPKEQGPTEHPYVKEWMVDEISQGLPYIASREAIVEALKAYKGNMSNAISCLMPASSGSSSRTSSIERVLDSDDEIDNVPKKKASCHSNRPHPLHIRKSNKSFPADSEISPDPSQLSAALSRLTGDDVIDLISDDEDQQIDSVYRNSGTTSVSTVASESSGAGKGKARPIARIKLSQPRKPVEKAQPSLTGLGEETHHGGYDADADGEKPSSPRVAPKPRRRLISGNEREKLRAEKAKKLSPRASVMRGKKISRRTSLSPTSANPKKSSESPPVADDIKILRL